MKFPHILKKLRSQDNINQNELAKAIGVSRSTIGMYEAGKREPDFETMEAIADYFNVSMDYLHGKSEFSNYKKTFTENSEGFNKNTVKIAGRDGSYVERSLTDEQLEALKKMVELFPDADNL